LPAAIPNETKHIEFLFKLYDKYTSGLFQPVKKEKKKKAVESGSKRRVVLSGIAITWLFFEEIFKFGIAHAITF